MKNVQNSNEIGGLSTNPFSNLSTEVISISDTICLISYGDCDNCLEFHAALSAIIIVKSIEEQIPVRGATCYGYFSATNNIIIGPAVDEVASWYEQADWIGVFQTPSAMLNTQIKNYLEPNFIINYRPVLKAIPKQNMNCVNWTKIWEFMNHDEKHLIDTLQKLGPITPEIGKKIFNTLDFYKHCLSQAE